MIKIETNDVDQLDFIFCLMYLEIIDPDTGWLRKITLQRELAFYMVFRKMVEVICNAYENDTQELAESQEEDNQAQPSYHFGWE